ncbi:uncharacterized protein LOC106473756 isoform X1 [Limulus polyphemus]|uniref:Uncharacterized protein LOC106473756 isoform X1 n=1 Tax=Limulus polyphemus TaxID=6850 RepID=A0ABM1TPQ3_LIMPO|nr:uncharacterized protein LOC106473756 isoform X1 [Limulus polyphemus]
MRVQQSEFLCRLSLIFLKDALPSSRAKESALKRLKVTRDVLEKLYLSNMETLNVLYKTHHYHRSLKMVQVSERERKPYESEHSSVKSLCVTIHSLILHLQAALLRVKTIEEHVDEVHKESVKSAGQNESLLSLVNDELHTMDGWLDEVSAEIQASSDCVSQSQMLIKQILGIKMNPNLETSIQDSGLHNNKQRTEKVEIIDSAPSCLHIGDPMIEDQVFEAYIDESEKSHNLISDSFFLSEHDRVKKKQELETSTRLFKELCSVLVVRKEGCRQKELDGPLAREKNDSALPDKSNCQDVINAEDFVVLQSSVDEVEKEDKIISGSCSFEDKKMTKIKNFQDQSCEHLLNNEQNVESKSDDFNSDSIKNTCKSKGFSPSYNIPSEKENSRTDEILKLKVPGVSDGNLFFTKTVAALAAERSKLFGLSGQTVLGESEECFEDSDNNSDCENIS